MSGRKENQQSSEAISNWESMDDPASVVSEVRNSDPTKSYWFVAVGNELTPPGWAVLDINEPDLLRVLLIPASMRSIVGMMIVA